jgi:tryptophan-rich sensory protein
MSITTTPPRGIPAAAPDPLVRRARNRWRAVALLAGVLTMVVPVAVVTAVLELFARDVWYENLRRPWWAASTAALLVAGSLLYAGLALAGWRIWLKASGSAAVSLWVVALGFSLGWTATFFGLWLPRLSLVVAATLVGVSVATAITARRHSPLAAGILLVFTGWAAYLAAVTTAVVTLN